MLEECQFTGHDLTQVAVHRQVEVRIVILHMAEPLPHPYLRVEFLAYLASEGRWRILTGLYLATGKLPPVLPLTVSALRGKSASVSSPYHGSDHIDCLHRYFVLIAYKGQAIPTVRSSVPEPFWHRHQASAQRVACFVLLACPIQIYGILLVQGAERTLILQTAHQTTHLGPAAQRGCANAVRRREASPGAPAKRATNMQTSPFTCTMDLDSSAPSSRSYIVRRANAS